MKFTELIPLSAAVINFSLTLFVFSRDYRSKLNWVYILWGISITVWNTGVFFLFGLPQGEQYKAQALFWARFLQFGVIFLPISLFHLCVLITKFPIRRLLYVLYGIQCLLALSNFTNFFVKDVVHTGYAYYSKGGPGFWLFASSYLLLTTATVVTLYKRQRLLPPLQRARVRSLLWACGILIFFGNNDILPILGVYHYPGTSVPIYPFGSAAAIVYGIIVGYSVLQNQLLDIHVTLGQAAAWLVRLLFFSLIGFSLLLIIRSIFPEYFSPFALYCSLAVLFVSAAISSKLFPRLFGGGSDALERRILGDRFEYHDKIQGFIRSIPWYADTPQLLKDLHELLVKTVRVKSYQIILLDESTRAFSLFCSYPERPPIQLTDLHSESPVFEVFRRSKREYLSCSRHYAIRETELEKAAKEQLREFAPDFCFPFVSEDERFGLLLIGPKDSDEPYTPHDLHLLSMLVKNLGSVINQIRLKNQVLLAEELELLGRMSRGMAHDMNNLLTPVSTYLQLSAGPEALRNGAGELLPTAMRNVETMHAYIKEALFFSKNHTLQIQEGRLDQVIVKALDLVETKLKRKKVQVVMAQTPKVSLEMDIVLIQRLLGNVLSNGIDASPAGSRIRVEVIQLAKTEAARDWWRIRIIDQGQGISEENLRRIFTPYFTTKDKGDHDRGFGLGLAICRKIVNLHGGNLGVTSEEQKGTTVQIDLPSRQITSSRVPDLGLATVAAS